MRFGWRAGSWPFGLRKVRLCGGLRPSVRQRFEPSVGLSSPAPAGVLEGRSCYLRQVRTCPEQRVPGGGHYRRQNSTVGGEGRGHSTHAGAPAGRGPPSAGARAQHQAAAAARGVRAGRFWGGRRLATESAALTLSQRLGPPVASGPARGTPPSQPGPPHGPDQGSLSGPRPLRHLFRGPCPRVRSSIQGNPPAPRL